jgi:hypothetical protein
MSGPTGIALRAMVAMKAVARRFQSGDLMSQIAALRLLFSANA